MTYRLTITAMAILTIPALCSGVRPAAADNGYPRPSAWDSKLNQAQHLTGIETAIVPRPPANAGYAAPYQTPPDMRRSAAGEPAYGTMAAPSGWPDATALPPYAALPAPFPAATQEPSALERLYQSRVVDNLRQFGYDLFGVPTSENQAFLSNLGRNSYSIPSGAVADDFALDIGDQIEIVFTGQRHDRDIYTVNQQGQLMIRDFPPIPAAGRSIGQVRISVEAAARNLHNTQAHLSLASVRQISVLIVGHVRRPGRQNLTVFHTILDALMESGGIEKTGSLRQIKLIRDGRSQIIDIYSLLLYGAANTDLQLRDGDRLIVPPIGPTIAVSGKVKRPGIFEILPRHFGMKDRATNESEQITLNDALELAGGVLVSGDNRFLKLGAGAGGAQAVEDIRDPFRKAFADGAILIVSKGDEKQAGMVELAGHTRKPGIHALSEAQNLSALLPDASVLGDDIYPLIGIIERFDPEQLSRQYIEFPLKLVIAGDYDRSLQQDDVIHLFSNRQIRALNMERATGVAPAPESGDGRGDAGAQNGGAFQNATYNTGAITDEGGIEQGSRLYGAVDIATDNPVLAAFLKERAVFLRGAVRNPGYYPVATGVTLDTVLAAAGGLALEANTGNIEVTSNTIGEGLQKDRRTGTRRLNVNMHDTNLADITIGAGDSIRVNQRFDKIADKSVLVIGEVGNPGRYDLIPGDTVSDLLQRAGGLTPQAYPEGSIFSRANERKAEESRYRGAARDLERALAVSLEKGGDKAPDTTQISMARELAAELREVEAIGRITVETDPGILATHPEQDMLLESGDRIFIPKRPMSVRVSGEILSPASLQFREGKKPLDYIHEAGGFTYHADKDRTFVLYPDGSAQPLQVGNWNYRPIFIPPGSTIVVPRDPKPFDFIESAKDISQILSNLAVTAIFLDDIRDDE